MEERETTESVVEEHLMVPDPVSLQLQRSGRLGAVRVITDRPPPVRRRGLTGCRDDRSTRR